MREKVNLYRKPTKSSKPQEPSAGQSGDWPEQVPLEELLTDMQLGERGDQEMANADDDDDDDSEEEDDDDDDSL